MAGGNKLLIYLLRRDLRVSDNPILHHLSATKDHGFTHLLPIFVFPAHQVEVSGFLKDGQKSPYPPAVSQVGGFWRCGPHRAKFLAQSVWDLKNSLETLNSGLILRVGSIGDVLKETISSLKDKIDVGGVWMTEEVSYEERQEHKAVKSICAQSGVDFRLWGDEKYFVDDRDTGITSPSDLPDIFTSYRKIQEPLRERPRPTLATPETSTLPLFLDVSLVPRQQGPFVEANNLDELESRLLKPLTGLLTDPPPVSDEAISAHPFKGGETRVLARVEHLIKTGAMSDYKETRNGLIGEDFSTKFSAYLALGCISARQIHEELVKLEDGISAKYASAKGYGKGENDGTRGVRFELLWRDYMRLCTKKFGSKLFSLEGFRQDSDYTKEWKTANKNVASADQKPSPEQVSGIIKRFLEGSTGMGLIDASQRELFHTGYTSNRARQNVASFLSKHLGIDWRYGAEWYEMLLVDYDVSSNWSNWQYVAGVGNDPRGDARIFNPVKQAFDYDKNGDYVRNWVPEVKQLEKPENLFQPSTASKDDLEKAGLSRHIMVTDPVKRIEFTVDRKPKGTRKPFQRRRGNRGGRGGNNNNGGPPRRGGGGGGGGSANGSNNDSGNASSASAGDSGGVHLSNSGGIVNGSTPQGSGHVATGPVNNASHSNGHAANGIAPGNGNFNCGHHQNAFHHQTYPTPNYNQAPQGYSNPTWFGYPQNGRGTNGYTGQRGGQLGFGNRGGGGLIRGNPYNGYGGYAQAVPVYYPPPPHNNNNNNNNMGYMM